MQDRDVTQNLHSNFTCFILSLTVNKKIQNLIFVWEGCYSVSEMGN